MDQKPPDTVKPQDPTFDYRAAAQAEEREAVIDAIKLARKTTAAPLRLPERFRGTKP